MPQIICTIGPATFGKVEELKSAGMSIARLNFAYATNEQLDLLKGVQVMVDVRKVEDLQKIQGQYDYAAVSFITSAKQIVKARRFTKARIVSKIETSQALENINEIVKHSDVVMIARGDLAKNVGIENICLAQKKVLVECKLNKVPVIVATGLLESMIEHPEPRRAEVSDITNAIADGADYLLLANETAIGKYPVEATRFLKKIVETVKESFLRLRRMEQIL